MAPKGKALSIVLAIVALFASSSAFASIPRSTALTPAFDLATPLDRHEVDGHELSVDRQLTVIDRATHCAFERVSTIDLLSASITNQLENRLSAITSTSDYASLSVFVAKKKLASGPLALRDETSINDASELGRKLWWGLENKAAPFTEPATGLVYLRDRWYDPAAGTWLTPDSYGTIDSSNLYSYCANDPVNCSDPSGKFGEGPFGQYVMGLLAEKYVTDPQFAADADATLDVTMQVVASPAFQGTMQVVGGCGEAALGATAIAETGGIAAVPGWVAVAHGSDVCGAGLRTLWTGQVQQSLTKQGAQAALIAAQVDPRTADIVSTYIDLGISAYGTIGSSRALLGLGRASAIVNSAQELPELPPGYHYRRVGGSVQVVRNPGRALDLEPLHLENGELLAGHSTRIARSTATRNAYLRSIAEDPSLPSHMRPWLSRGELPPGYTVDHIQALFDGGLDVTSNMRLILVSDHIIHHMFYRPGGRIPTIRRP